jgi:enoyl-CoA hydratase/carnithine racemase
MDIETERQEQVLRIEINRPQKKNALTAVMYQALTDALNSVERDAGLRVGVIHGSPGVFTAGNDLGDFLVNPVLDETAPVFKFLLALSAASKPLVAAVNGAAVGVGTTLLLHCDLVYAGESAQFRLPFVPLGLCPEAASSYLLPAVAGYQRAAEKLLLGEPFGAAEARAMGFVNEVLPDGQVLERALAQARKLAALPPSAAITAKALMKRGQRSHVEQQMREEGAQFARLLTTPDAQQALAAFFSRKKPDPAPGGAGS